MVQQDSKPQKKIEETYLNAARGFKLYQDLFMRAPVGYLVLSTRGFVQMANQASAELLRVDTKKLISSYLPELNPPLGLKSLAYHFDETVDSRKRQSCILACIWPNGFQCRLQAVSQCLRNVNGVWSVRTILIEMDSLKHLEFRKNNLNSFGRYFDLHAGRSKIKKATSGTSVQPSPENADKSEHKHILLVDTDETVRDVYTSMLKYLGYRVTKCESGREVLEVFHQEPDSYLLLFANLEMPTMCGSELAAEARKLRSDLPVILYTGSLNKIAEKVIESGNVDKIIYEPFSIIGLEKTINEVLG